MNKLFFHYVPELCVMEITYRCKDWAIWVWKVTFDRSTLHLGFSFRPDTKSDPAGRKDRLVYGVGSELLIDPSSYNPKAKTKNRKQLHNMIELVENRGIFYRKIPSSPRIVA